MKLFSRKFTTREKAYLIILVLILIGLLYYYLVDIPVRSGLQQAAVEEAALITERNAVTERLTLMREMIAELETSDSYMPSYNNVSTELSRLNDLLGSSEQFYISIDGVTLDGNQVRRSMYLQFTADSCDEAVAIFSELTRGEDRCLISDVSMTSNKDTTDIAYGTVNVTAVVTFYETLVGGALDAGLPSAASE